MLNPPDEDTFPSAINIPSRGGDRPTGRGFAGRSTVLTPQAMAATSQPLATQIALDILKSGGHAVDAAIAANAALGLLEPMSCGLGGDLFALIWEGGKRRLHGLNASGRSPRNLTLDELRQQVGSSIPLEGALAVSVPGAVDGWAQLHQRFGRLPWGDLLSPTVRYAIDGFPVSELTAHHWQQSAPRVLAQPGFRDTWLVDGQLPKVGQRLRNADLAHSLESLARHGREAFYAGALADRLITAIRRHGGFLNHEDLAAHCATWDAPVTSSYRGYDVWQLPPNGQGLAVLQLLNLLEGFDLRGMGFGSVDHLHHLIEATRLVFEDRARWYADPTFFDVPVEALISKDYAAHRRGLIDPRRAATRVLAGDPLLSQGDTVCVVTADADRNMVSLMQSLFLPMGAGLTPKDTGFMLQNRGALFALDEAHANAYAPGRRPFHTIIPGFVTRHHEPYLCFGVMGGDAQPQGEVQVLLNLIDFAMDLQEAGDAPRLLCEGYSRPTGTGAAPEGGRALLESGFPASRLEELRERGHRADHAAAFYGGYQAILYDSEQNLYHGASECRQDGQAAGF